MLESLVVDNFTIIEHLEVDFHHGLSTLTGETGAGKSIIIDAIAQIAGAKSSKELIRHGSDKATILAEFSHFPFSSLKKLFEQNDIDLDEDYLSIQKEIKKNGRGIARINGSVVNGSFLRQVGDHLFNIEEQSKHQQLLNADAQLALLDAFSGKKLVQTLASYEKTYRELRSIKLKKEEIQKKNQDLKERLDYLKFADQEITEVDPKIGEDQRLEEKKIQLSNFEKISSSLQQIQTLIGGEDSIQDLLGQAQALSDSLENYGSSYQKIADNLTNAIEAVNDAMSEVSDVSDTLDLNDENELELVMERLSSFDQLKKKYGGTLEEVLSYQKKARSEIKFAENSEQSLKEYDEKYRLYLEQAHQLADKLTDIRKKSADKLEPLINSELKTLEFQNSKFEIKFTKSELQERGQDHLMFMVQTNIGEKMLPLAEIASGGELSRILLALKSVFSQFFENVTFIFDEIDSGVSGRAAQSMADKIYQIARSNQVISITHLPQLAAMSDYQYLIEKKIVDNRTISSVRLLDQKERVDEIAQMLTGTKMTKVTKDHAMEMLELAQKSKERE
ncbi:DNA repair protein RecN [Xylocopilactobacillus apis]|uniref:DNA repair protein RecN n=1 Tax=Xylocopilactobacillus apis TaxID=2932183 RepID=A0AAU9D3T5_9LACO|nr:DNA repair protein RecN [Xylocopilactobacillus apis]BDR56080.1 DNA repair protein RecN [Xylocopilactobacillus apis]